MKKPTVNIGDRQKGRIRANSIIDCFPEKESIIAAMKKASSKEFCDFCKSVKNPNGDGDTSSKIVTHIKEYCSSHVIDIKKKFYDVSFEL